ncbi:MAG TPA: DUF177 domain-containing protein [Bacteroidota bacterium]|nr:DUF177 domain-containing protein [Bacteroidota bacterium]
MAELRINVSGLSAGTHEYQFEAGAESLGLADRFLGPVTVDARLEKAGSQIFLKVSLKATGAFVCDRCLDEFQRTLDGSYSIVYDTEPRRQAPTPDQRMEIQVIPADKNYLDLDEDVRQYALLAVPQKMLCRENCAGLCPHCGKNRNRETCTCSDQSLDSRWEGLKDLLTN